MKIEIIEDGGEYWLLGPNGNNLYCGTEKPTEAKIEEFKTILKGGCQDGYN